MKTLQEQLKAHNLDDGCFAVGRIQNSGWDGQLTAMQDEVLSGEPFWNQAKNLIIRGTTSSGKTLLAEIAAYRQMADNMIPRKKVIFLVPLRALVTAQCRQIQDDFKEFSREDGKPLRIFESSADYQDHDAQILSGDYDIAVIVYEKFFALLNKKQNMRNELLTECGLVVVDELQMLSTEDRGPKMEFSIMRLLETCQQEDPEKHIRIIGLTTSESGVEQLGKWMRADIVGNSIRPVPLRQHFVSFDNGDILFRDILGETTEQTRTEPEEGAAKLDLLPRFECGSREEDKKRRCLYSLLNQWIGPNSEEESREENSVKKILIFANSKRRASEIAKDIHRKFPQFKSPTVREPAERQRLISRLEGILREFGDEHSINDLSDLIQYGIAFHHSGLPAVVRTVIEDDFRNKNGIIQIIVCTETLMIGMNLPADIVVLTDKTVYRGAGDPERITLQAYNNFVGRSGRLGLNDMPGYRGESYFLVNNLEYEYKYYTSNSTTAIRSPFRREKLEELAPYYLNWISGADNALMRIKEGLCLNFCYHESEEAQSDFETKANTILKQLINTYPNPEMTLVKQGGHGKYFLTRHGNALAPFALSLDTCATLLEFVEQRQLNRSDVMFIAPDNQEPIQPPSALLELVCTICSCSEVDTNPALRFFGYERDIRDLNRRVQEFLKSLYPETERRISPHAENEDVHDKLIRIAYSRFMAEEMELRQITRALILCFWLAGYSVRKIRVILSLRDIAISTSDIERIAEIGAHLMEAAAECQKTYSEGDTKNALHNLSIQMKYGVPYDLHTLASTHAREVTRNQLLAIRVKARQTHVTPREYVLASSDTRNQALRKALWEREAVESYTQQIENIQEDSALCRELYSELGKFDSGSGFGVTMCTAAIKSILTRVSANQGSGWSITENYNFVFDFRKDNQSYLLQFHVFDMNVNEDWDMSIREFFQDQPVPRSSSPVKIAVLFGTPPDAGAEFPNNQLVISSEFLGVLLAKCIRDGAGGDTVELIYRILADLQGKFILGGTASRYFYSYRHLSNLISGYLYPQPDTSKPGYLCFSNAVNPSSDSDYSLVRWGDSETDVKFDHSIVFYHPALPFSKSSEARLQSCDVILCSEADYESVKRQYGEARTMRITTDIDKMLELLTRSIRHQSPRSSEFRFGISMRGQYSSQMQRLKDELVNRGENVLLMNTGDFSSRMGGLPLDDALYREFSRCHSIIICDTHDYDESYYTAMVEFSVVRDKISSALKEHRRYPVFRVRLEGVEESHKLNRILSDQYSTYSDETVVECATEIINKRNYVESENRS